MAATTILSPSSAFLGVNHKQTITYNLLKNADLQALRQTPTLHLIDYISYRLIITVDGLI
jgi:hypothetical protein